LLSFKIILASNQLFAGIRQLWILWRGKRIKTDPQIQVHVPSKLTP